MREIRSPVLPGRTRSVSDQGEAHCGRPDRYLRGYEQPQHRKAVVNALEISSILKRGPIAVPPPLLNSYPELQEFSRAEAS
jgi:hypothetical protein